MEIDKRKKMKLSDVIDNIKGMINSLSDKYEIYRIGEVFSLYGEPSDNPLTEDMICYCDDIATIDDSNENDEIYPEFVVKNGLEFFYSGERFVDVVLSVLRQKKDPDISLFIDALNYYDENDDFLDIE